MEQDATRLVEVVQGERRAENGNGLKSGGHGAGA